MDFEHNPNVAVPPLRIHKHYIQKLTEEQHAATAADNQAVSDEDGEDGQPRQKFQNYLRACYPFEPSGTASPATVTLPLNAGDIVLIHSIHTNGWADGTLLDNGARGWLPTNYCEAYDYATMRPLLRSLTEFWDIIRSGNESNVGLFHNQEYMRGIIAGVRFLLERSDCLTRDCSFVRQHDNIRRARKSLLSDLSLLVKSAKSLQDVVKGDERSSEIESLLDDMLLRAFKIVVRAVKFFDAWSEEMASLRTLHTSSRRSPSPPAELPLSPISEKSRLSSSPQKNISQQHRHDQRPLSFRGKPQSTSIVQEQIAQQSSAAPPRARAVSTASKRLSATHRMSTVGGSHMTRHLLVSEQLASAYDVFLGVLASFLGSHMQSRSSAELLLTTQQAVTSCRQLLAVVEVVIEQDSRRSEVLLEAKDGMYDKITDLVHAAREVFRPVQSTGEDLIYLPAEGRHLVMTATSCVRSAGDCVAKTRVVLHAIGDFELELGQALGESQPQDSGSKPRWSVVDVTSMVAKNTSHTQLPSTRRPQSIVNRVLPRLNISPAPQSPSGLSFASATSSAPYSGILRTPTTTGMSPPMPSPSTFDSPLSPPEHEVDVTQLNRQRSSLRTVVYSTGSGSTYVSSKRDSRFSTISKSSTRATTPDEDEDHSLNPCHAHRSASVDTPAIEGYDATEAQVLEQTFAHELMFNAEGQVVGGTLNALVERLTSHGSTPDPFFISTIYLTFRRFTTPLELAGALAFRFEYTSASPHLAATIRLRVYNILKGWLENHWRHDCDQSALLFLRTFAAESLLPVLPSAARRLQELMMNVAESHAPATPRTVSSVGRTSNSFAGYSAGDAPFPAPVLSRNQLAAVRAWKMGGAGVSILDFDPLELARQITLKWSSCFCSILPEELLVTDFTKKSSSVAVNVRVMSTLSTDLTNLVVDSILQMDEPKKRAAIMKQWIKIGNKCLELNNFDTVMAICCAVNSTTITRLRRTWELVEKKIKAQLEELKKAVDHTRNYAVLRQQLQRLVPPCLPFLGVYLTDLTFTDHGNPATRQLNTGQGTIEVINLDKHMKTTKIISDLQRFQFPYRLTEVPELQTWLQDQLIQVRSGGEKSYQNQYRRSLVLEPKEQSHEASSAAGSVALTKEKERFDFLAWTHLNRDKSIATGI